MIVTLQTKQREQEMGSQKSNAAGGGQQYLNFLEKQVEKTHKVQYDMGIMSEAVNDIGARLDLMELGHQDLIKKFKILESIAMGSNDDQAFHKRSLDQLYLKLQDLEARFDLAPRE